MTRNARVIAFYLPQFHPIPENDKWWGAGFTEWTNVGKAQKCFSGHYQPRVPRDLGYYDLRNPETRQAQAEMAVTYGIEGFCYWHYWFGNGKRVLERPFQEVLASRTPDFPFCLGWANESWKGFAHGLDAREVLIEQLYPGVEDYTKHFYEILPAFKDDRYIRVDGCPLFFIYRPLEHPEMKEFISLWQELARVSGLKGVYFVAQKTVYDKNEEFYRQGFDALYPVRIAAFLSARSEHPFYRWYDRVRRRVSRVPNMTTYSQAKKHFLTDEMYQERVYPGLYPNWDHSPRTGSKGVIIHDSTPELFRQHALEVLDRVKDKPFDQRIVFLKSWNEWAEGNYIEPDIKFGRQYLEVIRSVFVEG